MATPRPGFPSARSAAAFGCREAHRAVVQEEHGAAGGAHQQVHVAVVVHVAGGEAGGGAGQRTRDLGQARAGVPEQAHSAGGGDPEVEAAVAVEVHQREPLRALPSPRRAAPRLAARSFTGIAAGAGTGGEGTSSASEYTPCSP